jgi:hypothetical protein
MFTESNLKEALKDLEWRMRFSFDDFQSTEGDNIIVDLEEIRKHNVIAYCTLTIDGAATTFTAGYKSLIDLGYYVVGVDMEPQIVADCDYIKEKIENPDNFIVELQNEANEAIDKFWSDFTYDLWKEQL